MDVRTAVDLINGIHFMPGWRISAERWGINSIRVTCEVDTVNSDRENALRGYPEQITLNPSIIIMPLQISSADELYAGILGWISELFLHEAREFLRVGPNMEAPFHPHKAEGDARFAAALA